MYALVYSAANGVSVIGWALLVFAFVLDLGSYRVGVRGSRKYRATNVEPVEVKNLNDK